MDVDDDVDADADDNDDEEGSGGGEGLDNKSVNSSDDMCAFERAGVPVPTPLEIFVREGVRDGVREGTMWDADVLVSELALALKFNDDVDDDEDDDENDGVGVETVGFLPTGACRALEEEDDA